MNLERQFNEAQVIRGMRGILERQDESERRDRQVEEKIDLILAYLRMGQAGHGDAWVLNNHGGE